MRRRDSHWLQVALALAAWLGGSAHATAQSDRREETTFITLEPIVVTGTVLPSTIEDSGGSVTVITREQIAIQQARSVTDLLRDLPGVHVDQAGGGPVGSIYLRGADPNYTVVLIDGVKVNDPTNSRGGSVDLSTLEVAHVERVEIVRGPMSSLYGSDALAGVVNIITHRGTVEAVRDVELSGGSDGSHRAVLRAQGMRGDTEYSLSGSFRDLGTATEGSRLINKAVRGSLDGLAARRLEVRSSLSYTDSHRESFPDDSGGPSFAALREVEERDSTELTLGVGLSSVGLPTWFPDLAIQYVDREERTDSPGVAPGARDPAGIPPYDSDTRYRRHALTLIHRVTPAERLLVGLGLEAQSETGSSRGNLSVGGTRVPTDFDMERDAWAPFVEARYAVSDAWRVQAGLRLDVPSEFDSEVSVRSAVSYRIASTNTTLRASWGEGFKLPSFFALGHPIVGNPDLVPERSRGGEVAVTQSLWGERVTLRAAYFSSVSRGTIDLQEGPPPLLVNRSKVTWDGAELEVEVRPTERLRLSSHLTYVETDIAGTNEELRNRPAWRGGVVAQWRPRSSVAVHVDALSVGRALDSSIPTGDRYLTPYTRVNLAITWTAGPIWRYFLAVDNLFDADYEEAIGFPSPGFTLRIGVRAAFS